jgi:hypothetical protein
MVLKERGQKDGLDSSDFRIGTVAGSCEHSNEHLGFIKKLEVS